MKMVDECSVWRVELRNVNQVHNHHFVSSLFCRQFSNSVSLNLCSFVFFFVEKYFRFKFLLFFFNYQFWKCFEVTEFRFQCKKYSHFFAIFYCQWFDVFEKFYCCKNEPINYILIKRKLSVIDRGRIGCNWSIVFLLLLLISCHDSCYTFAGHCCHHFSPPLLLLLRKFFHCHVLGIVYACMRSVDASYPRDRMGKNPFSAWPFVWHVPIFLQFVNENEKRKQTKIVNKWEK